VAQADRAEQQVFDPDFEPFTGGIAGSLLGYVPGSIFSPVHFGDGSGLRAIDLLNQIALQLRESGWLIIAQPDGSALATSTVPSIGFPASVRTATKAVSELARP